MALQVENFKHDVDCEGHKPHGHKIRQDAADALEPQRAIVGQRIEIMIRRHPLAVKSWIRGMAQVVARADPTSCRPVYSPRVGEDGLTLSPKDPETRGPRYGDQPQATAGVQIVVWPPVLHIQRHHTRRAEDQQGPAHKSPEGKVERHLLPEVGPDLPQGLGEVPDVAERCPLLGQILLEIGAVTGERLDQEPLLSHEVEVEVQRQHTMTHPSPVR
mmetsp:Transcript_45474/g.120078  ORF Transcript_45474/g.120078 Transcript_45474/m.120078 type:complete len:216 (-) Transcript_45474:730-1377(-)